MIFLAIQLAKVAALVGAVYVFTYLFLLIS
jgi:hypothetical protein